MGLDTTAFRGITRVADEREDGDMPEIDPEVTHLYQNPDFPDRAPEIQDGWFTYEGFESGIHYAYSYHMRFRDELAKLAGWKETTYEQFGKAWPSYTAGAWRATEGPFWELLNFSDCEGCIGTAACAKLAGDFAAHQGAADAHPDPRFRLSYSTWRRNFEFASDRGAVKFS